MAQVQAEQEKLQNLCNDYAKQIYTELGLSLPIEMDWSFMSVSKFQDMSDSSKKDMIARIGNSFIKTGITHQEFGFIPFLKKSTRATAILRYCVTKIVVQLTPETSIQYGVGNSYFQLTVDLPTLIYRVRMDSLTYTDGWAYKLDYGMKLGILFELWTTEVNAKVKIHEQELAKQFGKFVPLVLDWDSLANHSTFINAGDSTKKSYCERFCESFIKTGLFNSGGFIEYANKSERAKAVMQQTIERMVFRIHPTNDLKYKVDNTYYMCDFDNGSLIFTVRLDSLTYTNGFGYKTDVEMKLDIAAEMMVKKANEEFVPVLSKFCQEYGRAIPLEIDWGFMKTEKFLGQGDSTKANQCITLTSKTIKEGLLGNEGLSVWAKRSARYKYTVDQKVGKIIVAVTPATNVEYGVGNTYYMIKYDSGIAYVTIRMDSLTYTDGWGLKFDYVLNICEQEELAMREAEKKVADIYQKFAQAVQQQIPLVVDWASFVEVPKFKEFGDSTRKSYISNSTKVLEVGLLTGSNNLSNHVSKDLLPFVRLIVLRVLCVNQIQTKVGNTYYDIDFENGALIVSVRLDSLNYTDGFGAKLESLRSKIQTASYQFVMQVPVHKFLSMDFSNISATVAANISMENPLLIAPAQPLMSYNPSAQPVMHVQPIVQQQPVLVASAPPTPIYMPVAPQPVVIAQPSPQPVPVPSQPIVTVQQPATPVLPARDTYGFPNEIQSSEKKIADYATNLNQKLGKQVTMEADWTFLQMDAAKATAKDTISRVGSSMAYYISNQIQNTANDALAKSIICSKLNKIVLQVDVNNSIPSPNYTLTLDNGALVVRCNMGNANSSLSNLSEKVEDIFEILIPRSIRDSENKMKENEQSLASVLGKSIPFTADWSWTTSSEFLTSVQRSNKTSIILAVGNSLAYYFFQFIKKTAADEIGKQGIIDVIENVILCVDPKNSVNDKIQPNNYCAVMEGKTLRLTVNMQNVSSSLSYIEKKFESILNIRIKQAIRDSKLKWPELEKRYENKFGKKILLEVDWNFCAHPNFLSFSFDEYATIIQKIANSHLYYLVTGVESLASDNIFKEQFSERVHKIQFTYDPENKVNDEIKPNLFSLRLVDRVLYLTLNLKDWNSSISYIPDKLDPIMLLRVSQGQRDFNAKKEPLEKTLAEQGYSVKLSTDWIWTTHANFLKYPLPTHTEIINKIANNHFYYFCNGLKNTFEKIPNSKQSFSHFIKHFVFAYEPEDKIRSTVGDSKRWAISRKDDTLFVTMNLNEWNSSIDYVEVKVRPIALNLIEEYESLAKITNYQQSLASTCGKPISVQINWPDFAYTDKFMNHAAQQEVLRTMHAKHTCRVVECVNASSTCHSIGKDNIMTQLNHIQMDMNRQASEYSISFENNVLSVSIPFQKPLEELKARDVQIRIEYVMNYLNPIRIALANNRIENMCSKAETNIGKRIPVSVDWGFSQTANFLSKTPEQIALLIENVADKAAKSILSFATDMCIEHPINKATFVNEVNNIRIIVADSVPKQFGLSREGKELRVTVDYAMLLSNNPVLSFPSRFQFFYDIIIPIAVHNSKSVYERLQKQMLDACQKPITIDVDLGFASTPEFRGMETNSQVSFAAQMCSHFEEHVHGDILKLCSHPVSKQFVQQNIDKLIYATDIANTKPHDGFITFANKTLFLTCNFLPIQKNKIPTVWKSKIEYLFDLIVAIAAHDAEPTRANTEAALRNALGWPINIVLDFGFSKSSEFKDGYSPDTQSAIIFDLTSKITGTLAATLKQIALQPSGKTALSRFQRVFATYDITNSIVNDATVKAMQNDLVFTMNLKEYSKMLTLTMDQWKEMVCEELGIVVEVAREEVLDTFLKIQEMVNRHVNGQLPIQIDWTFATSPEFRGLTVGKRVGLVKHLCTKWLQITMQGFEYFAGYESITLALLSSFKSIRVEVLSSSVKNDEPHLLRIDQATLIVSLPWEHFLSNASTQLGYTLENTLKLRPMIEVAVMKRVDTLVDDLANQIAQTLSKKIPITVEWSLILGDELYKNNAYYKRLLEIVPHSVQTALMSSQWGIPSMFPAAKDALMSYSEICIMVNVKNSTRNEFAKQSRYACKEYDVTVGSSRVCIEINSSGVNGSMGAALNIAWAIAPNAANHMEEKMYREILENPKASDMKAIEPNDRPKALCNMSSSEASNLLNVLEFDKLLEILKKMNSNPQLNFLKKIGKYELYRWLKNLSNSQKEYLIKALDKEGRAYIVFGKIEVVKYHGHVRVEVVKYHGDMRVTVKKYHADEPGEWEYVKYHGDWQVEFVQYHGDFRVELKE